MTDPHQQQTPPAWYPDPDPNNPGGQRWWDGTRWTEHSRPAGPVAQPLYDARQNAQQQTQAQPGHGQPGYGQPAYAQPGYTQPAAQQAPAVFPPVTPGTSALTWSVWLVVGLPLLPAIGYMFLDFSSYMRAVFALSASGSSPSGPDLSHFSSALSGFVVGVLLMDLLALVIYGLTVMFAYFDWRELQRRGFARPFHWAWAFLAPMVYVIGRTVVAHRRGARDAMWPIWGLVAVTVIGIVLIVVKVVIVLNAVASTVGTYVPGMS